MPRRVFETINKRSQRHSSYLLLSLSSRRDIGELAASILLLDCHCIFPPKLCMSVVDIIGENDLGANRSMC